MNPLPDLSDLGTHGQGRQTITLHEITGDNINNIPMDIKTKLLHKTQLVQDGIKNKDEATLAEVKGGEAIKVPYFD